MKKNKNNVVYIGNEAIEVDKYNFGAWNDITKFAHGIAQLTKDKKGGEK